MCHVARESNSDFVRFCLTKQASTEAGLMYYPDFVRQNPAKTTTIEIIVRLGKSECNFDFLSDRLTKHGMMGFEGHVII